MKNDYDYVKFWAKAKVAESMVRKGEESLKIGKLKEAKAAFIVASQECPNLESVWFGKGILEIKTGNRETAFNCFAKATKYFSNELRKDPNNLLTWLRKGCSHYYQLEYDLAMQSFKTVVEKEQRNVNAWYNLGVVEYQLEKHREASSYFYKALDLDLHLYTTWLQDFYQRVKENVSYSDVLETIKRHPEAEMFIKNLRVHELALQRPDVLWI